MQPIIMQFLYVGFGSAIGGTVRYALSLALATSTTNFPWATFTVNLLGSLAIGVLSGLMAHCTIHGDAVRAFAIIGICGGFTTFSTFSHDAFKMLENSQWGMLLAYVTLSVITGITAVAIGWKLAN